MKEEVIKILDLKDMLKKSGEKYANKIAYKIKIEKNKYKEISHKEVREKINALGTKLIDLGLKNKRIAVIGENRYEWEIAYLSIVCGTGIVVPLDKSLPENELKQLIERSEVEAIFYSKRYEELLEKEQVGKLKCLICLDDIEMLIKQGQELINKGDRRFIDAKIDNKIMNMMLFTSGTTSNSKAVALSHNNICSNLMDLASILDVNSDDIFLSFLPLHHVFECTVGFLFALYRGAQTTFCDGIRHIPENLVEYHISVMASVPAIYERLFKIIRKNSEKHDMLGGNIRLLISGAASLDSTTEETYRELGLNLVQGYGLTETSPVVAIGTNKYHRVGSIGKAIPSVEVKLVNEKDGIGELVVKGPNVMLGYFENEKETKKVIKDGWFHTGDLAKIDKDGYIFICGRKKNVIVLKNGKNIFPEEMENMINKEDGIEESFVFGKPISSDPNDIKVFAKIVYNQEFFEGKEEQEIKNILNETIKRINRKMPHYKAIRGIIITTHPLIKTTTNKIKREKNLEQIIKEEL